MAGDIRRLLREHLGVEGPVVVAGHDIGLMVAYAYAAIYRDEVSHLVVVDAPLPGTEVFDRLRSDPNTRIEGGVRGGRLRIVEAGTPAPHPWTPVGLPMHAIDA